MIVFLTNAKSSTHIVGRGVVPEIALVFLPPPRGVINSCGDTVHQMITAPDDDDDDDDDKGEKGEDTDLPGHHPNASLLGLVIRLFAYIVHTTL